MNKFIIFSLLTPLVALIGTAIASWMLDHVFPEKSSSWQVKEYGDVMTVIALITVLTFWAFYFI